MGDGATQGTATLTWWVRSHLKAIKWAKSYIIQV